MNDVFVSFNLKIFFVNLVFRICNVFKIMSACLFVANLSLEYNSKYIISHTVIAYSELDE